ncbi:hypothetical protein E2562_031770 [Oryza meyeriana var. granulata]|uniref:PIR2-like helical domain-containing protein n=1 Tax=Oryza meyeriana var. granulata TaxID=110450 RepID=A0A6G1CUG1_9ORYZ|nr:hypothetical protein E2562_031770 [Oryza meyeriana var. granulata]
MAGRRRRGGSAGGGASAGASASAVPNLSDGSLEGMARNRRVILGLLYGYYEEALDALPLERMPALTPRLLDAGVCFGFADPVTNIIANTLCFIPGEGGDPAGGEPGSDGARKRKRGARSRGEVLSKIVAGDVPSPPEARTIAERSLEGLTTFLTSYYRYLPTWDALRYLCLSRADLLVAVHLIEVDRCHRRKDRFHIRSHAANTALKCAALSARLPNVDAFFTGSAAAFSHLTHTVRAENCCRGRRRRRLSIQDVTRFSGLLEKPLNLNKSNNPMDHAAMRCHQYDLKVSPTLTPSLRGLLLDRIHVVYLKAISRIPIEDFRSRYHHGLLKAGYCYGPFNPIFNIIVNTVWYDAAFPAPETYELDMVCTRIFIRIESRSLAGLINLLLARVSGLSEHDAMVYLLKSNLELPQAIRMAGQNGYDTSSWGDTAYKAAADASFHPEVEAYVQFAMESLPMVKVHMRSYSPGR